MRDENKPKEQLINELADVRQLVIDFIASENKRKRAEEEQRSSAKFNHAVLNSMMTCIAVLDRQGNVIAANDACKQFTLKNGKNYPFLVIGGNYLELYRQAPREFAHLAQQAIDGIEAVLSGAEGSFSMEYPAYPQAAGRWFLLSATPLTDGYDGVVISHAEITGPKQAEEKLRGEERLLLNVFASIQDGICIIDHEHNILRVNPVMERWYTETTPLAGKKCYHAFHGRGDICQDCPSLKALETRESTRSVVPKRKPDGSITGWLELFCYPLIDTPTGQVKGVIEYVRDITENVKTEQEVALSEKLNLAVELAAGIGHEFRNPMTTVRGLLQMLGGKEDCSQYKEYFSLMIEEVDRANSIISELVSLAQNRNIELKTQNINTLIKTLSPEILDNAISAKKHIMLDLQDTTDIALDENEIRQLLLNLVKNGLEAMSEGKCLTIRTFTENSEVVLSVQDEGEGIKPGVLEKIGTPFFTTKDKGTGLGLAVCHGIASRHNATINMATSPAGTTFFVRFKKDNSGYE